MGKNPTFNGVIPNFPNTPATFEFIFSPFLTITCGCFIASFPFSTATFNPTPESSEIAGPGIKSVGPGSICISSGAMSPAFALTGL